MHMYPELFHDLLGKTVLHLNARIPTSTDSGKAKRKMKKVCQTSIWDRKAINLVSHCPFLCTDSERMSASLNFFACLQQPKHEMKKSIHLLTKLFT